jgi:hypothetical protein
MTSDFPVETYDGFATATTKPSPVGTVLLYKTEMGLLAPEAAVLHRPPMYVS